MDDGFDGKLDNKDAYIWLSVTTNGVAEVAMTAEEMAAEEAAEAAIIAAELNNTSVASNDPSDAPIPKYVDNEF